MRFKRNIERASMRLLESYSFCGAIVFTVFVSNVLWCCRNRVNGDVAWYLYAVSRLRDGAVLYTDIRDFNLHSLSHISSAGLPAELILGHARKAMEREDLEARLEALEQAAAGRELGPRLVGKPADPKVQAAEARPRGELSRRQEKILLALLEYSTDEKAAAAAGVSVATVGRCRKIPEFQKAYREARRIIVFQAMNRLQQACPFAAQTLLRLVVETGTPPATRLRAADAIVRFGLQGPEFDSCEARLFELERDPLPIRRVA
jgi:hypothetical protein